MSFYEFDNLRAVSGGRWIKRMPDGSGRLEGVGIDSREDLTGKIFVAIRGDRHDGHDHLDEAVAKGARLLILERPPAEEKLPPEAGALVVPDTRAALGRLARAYRQSLRLTKVIAITGSAGKTTTKQLVHEALSTAMRGRMGPASFNNDIGVPLTILSAQPTDQYLVVEIGSNAPGEVAELARIAEPDVAVVTMIGHGHLAGLGDLESVAREKVSILLHLRHTGLAVLNGDMPLLRQAARTVPSAVLFGESEEADLRLTGRGCDRHGWWFDVNGRIRYKLGLPGRHNAFNALAAVAVARRFGINDLLLSEGLGRVTAAPMRFQRQDFGDLRVYNDAYNANPESMIAALETFGELEKAAQRRVLVLGEMRELGRESAELHRQLADEVIELDRFAPIDAVVLIGRGCEPAAEVLKERWDKEKVCTRVRLTAAACNAISEVVGDADAVLVKGSRAVGLERVVERLSDRDPGKLSVTIVEPKVTRRTKAAGRAPAKRPASKKKAATKKAATKKKPQIKVRSRSKAKSRARK